MLQVYTQPTSRNSRTVSGEDVEGSLKDLFASLVSDETMGGSASSYWMQKTGLRNYHPGIESWQNFLVGMGSSYIKTQIPMQLQSPYSLSGSSVVLHEESMRHENIPVALTSKHIIARTEIFEFTTNIELSIKEPVEETEITPAYLSNAERELDVLDYFELSPSETEVKVEKESPLELIEVLDGDFEYEV